MKRLIFIALFMMVVGYLSADVLTHLIIKEKLSKDYSIGKDYRIGKKYYPVLFKIKERTIYSIHNRDRIKSYEKGSQGTQISQIRSGYKVNRH